MTRSAWFWVPTTLLLMYGLSMCFVFRAPERVIFSHKKHVEDEEMKCGRCHSGVDEAEDLSGHYLPKEDYCLGCHDEDEEPCTKCHTVEKPTRGYTGLRPQGLAFSHKNHVGRIEGDACETCHAGVAHAGKNTPQRPPEMLDECMSCHREDFRDNSCTKCHTDFIEQREKPFDLFSHRGDFLANHGHLARSDIQVCNHCHQQSDCAECHSQMAALRPSLLRADEPNRMMMHRGDWLSRHATEAGINPQACLSCHRADTCAECHRTSGIAARNGIGLGPHPAGWLTRTSMDFHGDAARRNIASCASCHERGRDTNCIACHKIGAAGGSPHPPGWSSRIDQRSGQACVGCHQP